MINLNRFISIIFITLSSITAGIAETANQYGQYKEDIILMQRVLEKAHPGYLRYASKTDLDAAWSDITTKAESSDYSQLQFYADASKLLAMLRCDHTKAELPKRFVEEKRERFLPFSFVVFDGRMFVDKSTNPLFRKGDEVTHINGVLMTKAIAQLLPYMAVDGYTNHAAEAKIVQDFDLQGSGFEQFFAPVVLNSDHYLTEYDIQVRTQEGQNKIYQNVPTIKFTDWRALMDTPYRMDFKDAVQLKINSEERIAILRVDTFVNYRKPVDAMALFSNTFEQIKQANVERLIVDLRRNGGGSDDAQIALMRHLYTQPFQLVDGAWLSKYDLGNDAAKLQSWDRTAIDVDKNIFPLTDKGRAIPLDLMGANATLQQPGNNAFSGEIIMLASKQNASASGALLAHIQQQANVTVLGEPTGGNQGGTTASVMGFLTLPKSDITIRVPIIRNRYAIKNAQDGMGALPDILVKPSFADWLANRDAIMESALTYD